VNYTAIAILGFIYVWLLLAILRYREDMVVELQCAQLAILTLAVPASLYAAVSGEREKLTWDSLIMTRLTPVQIIAGKLLWRLLLIAGIMALFTFPMLLCHFASGHFCTGDGCSAGGDQRQSLRTIFGVQFATFAWSVLLAGLSFFASSKSRRPITTLSIITVALLAFLALTPILVAMFGGDAFWPQYNFSPLTILGSFLNQVNPFYRLMLDTGNAYQRGDDVWHDMAFSNAVPFLYLGLAAVFFAGAHRTLRGLEVARRTIG
jgi:magnesium-transporting ATPase (P-type)